MGIIARLVEECKYTEKDRYSKGDSFDWYLYFRYIISMDESGKWCLHTERFHTKFYGPIYKYSHEDYISESFIKTIAGDAYNKCDINRGELACVFLNCIYENRIEDIPNEIEKFYFVTHKSRSERRLKDVQEAKDYRYVIDTLDGIIVGMDKHINITDKDFSIRLILKSSYDFEKRKKIFNEKKNEIIEYVKKEIEKDKRKMKRLGDLSYYYCSEIILLKAAEAEMIFSIKGT